MQSWDFWWNSVTGPRMFVTDAVNALLEGKLVVLRVGSDLPWAQEMRNAVVNTFQDRADVDVAVTMMNSDEIDNNIDSMGRSLLSRFAPTTVRDGYRQSSGVSLAEYIRENECLRGRLIWVTRTGRDTGSMSSPDEVRDNNTIVQRCVEFCADYAAQGSQTVEYDAQAAGDSISAAQNSGLFVLEVDAATKVTERRNMKVLNFDSYVNSYDVQVFNSFVVDGLARAGNGALGACFTAWDRASRTEGRLEPQMDLWKRYVATLVTSLCDNSAQLAYNLLLHTDFTIKDPVECVLALCPTSGDDLESELRRRVWSAQVQVLYPLIELERVQLIRSMLSLLKEALASAEVYLDYDKYMQHRIMDPMDLELGTLCYMMATPRPSDGYFILYVQDEEVRDRIRFLRECRNSLSHMRCCNPEDVVRLIFHTDPKVREIS